MTHSLSAWSHVASGAPPEDAIRLGEALRDAFFGLATRRPDERAADEALFRAIVERVDPEAHARLGGLGLAWHPTARCKQVRFLDAEHLPEDVRPRFARPSAELPQLVAAFVDPRELSFRTFENIIPLDRVFDRAGAELRFELAGKVKLGAKGTNAYSFTLNAPEPAAATLRRLDELDLYVPPMNACSRGGERYIFHSAKLAEALATAITGVMPKSLMGGFSHVNPVFRCNRFEPGDEKFHSHLDTPYYDAARRHVSKYTLIVYLTGGAGSPALRIGDDVELRDIAPMTCVVFDQQLEHEGRAFDAGRKVFLRTELIFEVKKVAHDAAIGALFAKACYLSGESVFAPELARHADDYYNRVAEAHWNGLAASDEPEAFVHKRFRGASFVANGHDYWFGKGELSLRDCAALTLLDYFNCSIDGAAFRTQCTSEVVVERGTAWIDDFLAERAPAPSPLGQCSKASLLPAPERPDASVCCPFHAWGRWDATRDPDIVQLLDRAQDFVRSHLLPAPVWMMGTEVFLDPERFVVEGHRIHVLAKEELPPINFAACWNSGGHPINYLDVAATVDALHVLVPPILFTETERGYHLMFDFFRNTWSAKSRSVRLPIPRIRLLQDEDPESFEGDELQPWHAAVDPTLVEHEDRRRDGEAWWSDDKVATSEFYE
jgi:hypothetical protein